MMMRENKIKKKISMEHELCSTDLSLKEREKLKNPRKKKIYKYKYKDKGEMK
jgi:hypothetical protein